VSGGDEDCAERRRAHAEAAMALPCWAGKCYGAKAAHD